MTFVDQRRCRVPGCAEKGRVHQHHVVYRQEVRREGGDELDQRNALTLCTRHHDRHHNRQEPIPLRVLRDENFAFAKDLLGAARAHEYLRRRYAGQDPRLPALLRWVAPVAACPDCGTVHEMIDLMDESPPIPRSAWPERWSIHDGEGRGLMFCPVCDEPVENFGLPDYPWKEQA